MKAPLLALLVALIALSFRASSIASAETLQYRLVVYGPSGSGPAPEGTSVMVYVSDGAEEVASIPADAVCASASTVNGLTEVDVTFTDACPAGASVGVSVAYPGQAPVAAEADPPIEWRESVAGDPLAVTVAVRTSPAPPSAAPPEPAANGLRYRLLVYGRDPQQVAPDGSTVDVLPLSGQPPPNGSQPAPNGGPSGPCAHAVVADGVAEIAVGFSSDCPEGVRVSFLLSLNDGEGPITGFSEPEIEWRTAAPDETQPIDLIVRPVPPSDAPVGTGAPVTGSISPPNTGSAGLKR
jgi:hypothetical protein